MHSDYFSYLRFLLVHRRSLKALLLKRLCKKRVTLNKESQITKNRAPQHQQRPRRPKISQRSPRCSQRTTRIQPFATRTNQLGVQFHNGIDYFTNQEQVGVQAVSDGRVMFVDIYERQPDGAFQINLAWQAPSGEIISYSLEPSAGPADAAKIAEQKILAQKMMESMTIQVGDQIVQGQFLGYLYGQDDWAHVHMSVKASDRGPEQWLCPADFMPTAGDSDLLAKSSIWADRLYKGSKQPELCNY